MFQPLKLCDLNAMLDLQNIVRRDLAEKNCAHYIVPRTKDYFMNHLQSPHQIIGLHDHSLLIAQGVLRAPQSFHLHDETGLLNISQTDIKTVSILQGALVHPTQRGRGLMKHMVHYWENWARQKNITHLMARSEVTHRASAHVFSSCGFHICGIVPDARDGASVHVWLKNVGSA